MSVEVMVVGGVEEVMVVGNEIEELIFTRRLSKNAAEAVHSLYPTLGNHSKSYVINLHNMDISPEHFL